MSLGADAAEQFKPQNPHCPQQWDGDRASQKKQRSQRNSLSEACLPGFLCVTLLPLTNPGVSARVCEGEESQLAAAAVQCVVRLQPTVRWNQHIAYCFLYDWETLDDLSCFEALMMSKASFPCYACCCLLCTICYICFQAVTLTTAHQLAYLSVYLSPLRILVSNKCSCSSLGRCWGTATNTSNAAHLLMHIMSLLFTYGDGVKDVTTHVLKESVKLHFFNTDAHIFLFDLILFSFYMLRARKAWKEIYSILAHQNEISIAKGFYKTNTGRAHHIWQCFCTHCWLRQNYLRKVFFKDIAYNLDFCNYH